ncbi:MAG: glycosyltransferase family 4 protein [Nitrosotalea sp.]
MFNLKKQIKIKGIRNDDSMSSKLKLCIFPNDPIITYYNKGEIKERYYNPKDTFDEIHIISFSEKDIEESKVQTIAGKATLKIHQVGKIKINERSKNLSQILDLVRTINPDIIRAYNPLVEGWFAAKCSHELGVPLFVSLHIQYDILRKHYKKTNFKRYLALKYTEKFVEPFVLQTASKITIVYRIIEPYVMKNKAVKPELLYNRIEVQRFSNVEPLPNMPKPLIISVGRLTEQKNHRCIIEAMKKINGHLLIIGDGELYDSLNKLIKDISVKEKITIIRSVPNKEIQRFYKTADIFALAYDPALEGIPIPVIEAMASGLPVVIPFPKKEYSDGLENIAIFSERDPLSFSKNINMLLNNSELRDDFCKKSFDKAKEFDNSIIEKRESEIYLELLNKR